MGSSPNRLLHFNGEMIDFQLNLDMDHRKRRRNRTTQSCLNCHTSKRKCDRKRPCSRCIQLGLTGLCVYEVDDPAIRDDPNVDEVTKLRNRIAELESLVRELRGKPHPRWVDSGANANTQNEVDLSDKWHTRAFKKNSISASVASNLSIKTEPEPNSDLSYHLYQHRHHHQLYLQQHDSHQSLFSPSPPLSMAPSSASSASSDMDRGYYSQQAFQSNSHSATCRCLINPNVASGLLSLAQQLQSVYGALNRLPEHASDEACSVLHRIADLNNFLHGHDVPVSYSGNSQDHHHVQSHITLPPHPNQQFSPLPSPHTSEFDHYMHHSPHHFNAPCGTPDNEIMSNSSVSSGGSTFSPCHQLSPQSSHTSQVGNAWYPTSPASSAGVNGLDHNMGSGYNPYFPMTPGVPRSPHPLQQQQQNSYEDL